MAYAKVQIADAVVIEHQSAIPPELAGWTDEALADVTAAVDPCPEHWQGIGFWPVVTAPVEFDPGMQRLSDNAADLQVDPATRSFLTAMAPPYTNQSEWMVSGNLQ